MDWNFCVTKRDIEGDHIELWRWTSEDELRINSPPMSDSLRNRIDQIILEAPLAECLTSPSEYIRTRRRTQQDTQCKP